jgi:hypothetical protein
MHTVESRLQLTINNVANIIYFERRDELFFENQVSTPLSIAMLNESSKSIIVQSTMYIGY